MSSLFSPMFYKNEKTGLKRPFMARKYKNCRNSAVGLLAHAWHYLVSANYFHLYTAIAKPVISCIKKQKYLNIAILAHFMQVLLSSKHF